MSGLFNAGTILAVVFVLSLLALAAELVYVLWRRGVFPLNSGARDSEGLVISMKLIYSLFKRRSSRIEHDRGGGDNQPPCPVYGSSPEVSTEVKLQGVHRPSSRVLSTIMEDREYAESAKSPPLQPNSGVKRPEKTRRVSSSLASVIFAEHSPEVTVAVVGNCERAPFTPPCDSPLYHTPIGFSNCGCPSNDKMVSFCPRMITPSEQVAGRF